MTNWEKHKQEIIKSMAVCCVITDMRGMECGDNPDCSNCYELNLEWLDAEYEEPQTNWGEVKQGTKVYCKQMGYWAGKFIAEYEDYIILLFDDGSVVKSVYTKDNYEVKEEEGE